MTTEQIFKTLAAAAPDLPDCRSEIWLHTPIVYNLAQNELTATHLGGMLKAVRALRVSGEASSA